MPIIQNLTKHLDDYLERKPDADAVDVAFTLAQKLTDEQLMRAIHEANLWSEILSEKVAGIAHDSWAQTVRDVVVHVITAEILQG